MRRSAELEVADGVDDETRERESGTVMGVNIVTAIFCQGG